MLQHFVLQVSNSGKYFLRCWHLASVLCCILRNVFFLVTGYAKGCGEGICHDYGDEPRFDESDRPANAVVLGRATWTVMHTTAAYLPDELSAKELESYKTLVSSMPIHYPGKGKKLMQKVFYNGQMQKELDAVKNKEDAQLWLWKCEDHGSPAIQLFL